MTYIFDLMETQRKIAKNIIDYLNLKHMTPEELAIKCGSSKQQIYKLIKCETDPKTAFIDRLAKAMCCTVPQLTSENYFGSFEAKIVKKVMPQKSY